MPPKLNTGTFTVIVGDVNEQPRFLSSAPKVLSVTENCARGTYLGVFGAQDPDIADVDRLVFTWLNPVNSSSGTRMFTVDRNTSAVTTFGEIDYEFMPVVVMRLKVTDVGGLEDFLNVTVNVVNVNEPPVITVGQVFTAYENWGRGDVVGRVVVNDSDADTQFVFNIVSGNLDAAFSIDISSGELSVSWDGALDFESIVVYNVSVRARVARVLVVGALYRSCGESMRFTRVCLQVVVTDNGVPGDSRLYRDTAFIIVRVLNVNDVAITGFAGTTVLPTAGGGVTSIAGVNFGRIAPLEDGSWGPPAVVSFGGFDGECVGDCFSMIAPIPV